MLIKKPPTPEQQAAINKIVQKHLNRARRSSSETAHQDAERLGMDEIMVYCRNNDIEALGQHTVDASIALSEF